MQIKKKIDLKLFLYEKVFKKVSFLILSLALLSAMILSVAYIQDGVYFKKVCSDGVSRCFTYSMLNSFPFTAPLMEFDRRQYHKSDIQ